MKIKTPLKILCIGVVVVIGVGLFFIAHAASPDLNLRTIWQGNFTTAPNGGYNMYTEFVVSGDFAYLVSYHLGLTIVDISDPYNPEYVATINNTEFARIEELGVVDIAVRDTTAFVLYRNSAYQNTYSYEYVLELVDVSSPTNPMSLGNFRTGFGTSVNNVSTIDDIADVAVYGEYVYLLHQSGYYVIDISDPTEPVLATNFVDAELFYSDVSRELGPHTIRFQGDYAYITSKWKAFYIIDISDPLLPEVVGSLRTEGEGAYRSTTSYTDIALDGNFAYVANWWRIEVIDISDPYNPTLVTTIEDEQVYYTRIQQDVSRIVIQDDRIYVATLKNGVVVFDISDVHKPTVVGRYKVSGQSGYYFKDIVMDNTQSLALVGDYLFVTNNQESQTLGNFYILESQYSRPKHDIMVSLGSGLDPLILQYTMRGIVQNKFWGEWTHPDLAVLFAYLPVEHITAGTRLTSGDFDGNKWPSYFVSYGSGFEPRVRSFAPGTPGEGIAFLAYPKQFQGGVTIAAGDVDGDGIDELITGTGLSGGPQVRVFDYDGTIAAYEKGDWRSPNDPSTGINVGVYGESISQFFAYEEHVRSGIRVATGDLDGDGTDEIITGAGPGGGPHIRTFDMYGTPKFTPGFFAFSSSFRGGVNVAAGDVNGDGADEIIVSADQGGGPHIRIFDRGGNLLSQFFAYAKDFRGGVNIASADLDGDGIAEIITGPGIGGAPHIRVFEMDGTVKSQFFAYDLDYRGGIFPSVTRSLY